MAIMEATSNGELTYSGQPLFLVNRSSDASNATGDGTYYSIPWNQQLIDSNWTISSGTTAITAPITGKYLFKISVTVGGCTSSHTSSKIVLVTSNKSYYSNYIQPYYVAPGSTRMAYYVCSILCDMDASDTATLQIYVYGSTKVVDVIGTLSSIPRTWMSGRLVY